MCSLTKKVKWLKTSMMHAVNLAGQNIQQMKQFFAVGCYVLWNKLYDLTLVFKLCVLEK